jgi:hypothetical protein
MRSWALMLTVTAAGIGTPIGILAGIYMAEYRKYAKLSMVVRFINDIMLSVPSIRSKGVARPARGTGNRGGFPEAVIRMLISAVGRLWPTSEAEVCIAACWSGLNLKRVLVALGAQLVSQPKRNDNMPNEFVVSQSCSRGAIQSDAALRQSTEGRQMADTQRRGVIGNS